MPLTLHMEIYPQVRTFPSSGYIWYSQYDYTVSLGSGDNVHINLDANSPRHEALRLARIINSPTTFSLDQAHLCFLL